LTIIISLDRTKIEKKNSLVFVMPAELDYSSSEESNKVENNAVTTKKEYKQKIH
jgi:presenilin-like A22 family membrane protease